MSFKRTIPFDDERLAGNAFHDDIASGGDGAGGRADELDVGFGGGIVANAVSANFISDDDQVFESPCD